MTNLASARVNDFSLWGRTYYVYLQAKPEQRVDPEDIGRIHVRTAAGEMLPLSEVASIELPWFQISPTATTCWQQQRFSWGQRRGTHLVKPLLLWKESLKRYFPLVIAMNGPQWRCKKNGG